jgi:hypothetical protein
MHFITHWGELFLPLLLIDKTTLFAFVTAFSFLISIVFYL